MYQTEFLASAQLKDKTLMLTSTTFSGEVGETVEVVGLFVMNTPDPFSNKEQEAPKKISYEEAKALYGKEYDQDLQDYRINYCPFTDEYNGTNWDWQLVQMIEEISPTADEERFNAAHAEAISRVI